jgi:hypothetical protein
LKALPLIESLRNIETVGICFGILSLVAAWYFGREMTHRRRAEMTLQQQRSRERLVDRIAQQIRQSLDLDRVLTTTVTEVQGFLNDPTATRSGRYWY